MYEEIGENFRNFADIYVAANIENKLLLKVASYYKH